MVQNRDATMKSGRGRKKLATKVPAALALAAGGVLALGAAGGWILYAFRPEVAAQAVESLGWGLAAGVFLSIALIGCLYWYFVRAVVGPLQIYVRLTRALAGGGDERVPETLLARGDEIGDLARALQDALAVRREEIGIADDMSAGDFTAAVALRNSADEGGTAVRRMAGVIGETLARIGLHVGQMTAGCEAIASASGALSVDGAGIADEVAGISTGIDQIKTHADDNTGMAERGGRLAGAGSQYIERGYEDVGEMGVVMLNMQACGDKIVRIAKSIGDIAFQTNLLALNASVEAARAGRHGKGFTIVAEEVRRLAARSRNAAEETSSLMKETVEQVELAAAIAGRINAAFADMHANMQEADGLMTKIAAASREQSGGIDRISTVLRRVDLSARQYAEQAEDVAEKAGLLAGKTGRLRQALGRFMPEREQLSGGEPDARAGAASLDVRAPRAIRHAGREQ